MFSKQTEYLGLPQWEPKDHPDFLTDMNEAFRNIDAGIQSIDIKPGVIDELNSRLDTVDEELKKEVEERNNADEGFQAMIEDLGKRVDEEEIQRQSRDDELNSSIIELGKRVDEEEIQRQSRDDELNSSIIELGKRVDEEEIQRQSRDDELNSSIIELGNKYSTLTGRISSLELKAGESENAINSLEIEDSKLIADITKINEDISQISSTVNSISKEVEANTDVIAEHMIKIPEIEEHLNTLDEQVAALDKRITDEHANLNGMVDYLSENICTYEEINVKFTIPSQTCSPGVNIINITPTTTNALFDLYNYTDMIGFTTITAGVEISGEMVDIEFLVMFKYVSNTGKISCRLLNNTLTTLYPSQTIINNTFKVMKWRKSNEQ